jgi:hypothetical protein
MTQQVQTRVGMPHKLRCDNRVEWLGRSKIPGNFTKLSVDPTAKLTCKITGRWSVMVVISHFTRSLHRSGASTPTPGGGHRRLRIRSDLTLGDGSLRRRP